VKRSVLVLAMLYTGASIIVAGPVQGATPKYETKLAKLSRSYDGAANETVYAGKLSSPERTCEKRRGLGAYLLLSGSAMESDQVKTDRQGRFEARIRAGTPIPDYEVEVIVETHRFGSGDDRGVCKGLDKTFRFAGTG
jgi:hypothetical protein